MDHDAGNSSLTEEQLALRSKGIGASEVAAVCNVDPYRNALDVYLEKTGQAEPFQGNEFTEWGNRLEDAIAEGYADRMDVQLERSDTVTSPEAPWMFCTPDRLITTQRVGVECKNRNYFNHREWGVPGTDEVPVEVVAQVQWTMRVMNMARWDVAVLLGGNRLGIYHLKYDEGLADTLVKRAHDFWHNNVLPRVTPALDGSESTSRYLNGKWWLYADILKTPTPEIEQLAFELERCRAHITVEEKEKARLENLIKDFIGNDLGIELPNDRGKITWKRPKSAIITNWKMIATGLKRGRHRLHAMLLDLHSVERASARRFLCQFKEGDR